MTRSRHVAPSPEALLPECGWCGGRVADRRDLQDHREWCLGDGPANARLLNAVANERGELTHEALVAAAQQARLGTTLRPD